MIKLNLQTRRLLSKSNYLNDSEAHRKIQEKLLDDNFLANLTAQEKRMIKNNGDDWVQQCRKEWHQIGRQVNISKLSVKPRCELCDTQLRVIKCHVENKYTKEQLWVGRECLIKLTDTQEGTRRLSYTPEQEHLYDEFINDSRNARIIEFEEQRPSHYANHVLPHDMYESEDELLGLIRSYIRNYVIRNKENRDKLRYILDTILKIEANISDFDRNSDYLVNVSTGLRDRLLNNQDNGREVIEAVKNNNGMINKQIAEKILDWQFLTDYLHGYRAKLKFHDVKLIVRKNGLFAVQVKYNGDHFSFNVPSSKMIHLLGYPLGVNGISDEWILFNTLTRDIGNNIEQTTKMALQRLALENLGYRYHWFYPSLSGLRTYIQSQEEGDDDRTKVNQKQFESLTSRARYLKIDGFVVVLDSQALTTIGFEVLESRSVDGINKQINQLPKHNITDIYGKMYEGLQLNNAFSV